jgi:hydroxybutyrate-dimer hydrolase
MHSIEDHLAASAGYARDGLTPLRFLRSAIIHTAYDGKSDDLLTGGLGATGLAKPAPTSANALRPTPAELRRLAIHTSYNALLDLTEDGGYGTLYGPAAGRPVSDDGKIAGDEYLAYAAAVGGGPDDVVTMMVQIPKTFNRDHPCLVTAPSSGSRGIYGAVATVGEWALKHGCAVVYTDKGTGIGAHDLERNVAYLINGQSADADALGPAAHFRAPLAPEERAAFNRQSPHRFAFKHAHSQRNPERHWGEDVLQSIEFAFHVLNLHFRRAEDTPALAPSNTLVIASSISNGGGASLRAAEADWRGWIDGVVVAEPAVLPVYDPSFVIVYQDDPDGAGRKEVTLAEHSRPLFDYITLITVFQPCASLDDRVFGKVPLNVPNSSDPNAPRGNWASPERCQRLHERGLLKEETPECQAREAQRIINDYGLLSDQNVLQPSYGFAFVPQAVAVTYANAYGRFSVTDNVCGYSFAATNASGAPTPLADLAEVALFGTGNGIPPMAGVINVINDAVGKEDRISTADQNLEGALCLRRLATGVDEAGKPLTGKERAWHDRIRVGIANIRASGMLGDRPAIIVHGRSDALIQPNHTARAYYGRNKSVDNARSRLRYYEVTNAQHFDAFNRLFAGYSERFVPLHYYFIKALDLMYDHLRDRRGKDLPPSQVIFTTPRGKDEQGHVPPINEGHNLPPIATNPAPGARIAFEGGKLVIPG